MSAEQQLSPKMKSPAVFPMKSDMCFPSTEEFLPLAWLFFTAMFSSWPSSGWYLIIPVPTVQSGNPVTASPRWSRSARAIVRHGLRTV